jgi:DNA-directed RNA polymerase subunit F
MYISCVFHTNPAVLLPLKVLNEKLVPLPIVAKVLEEESKKRELSSIEIITLEYAKKFSKFSAEDAERLLSELEGMGLPLEVAVQIVNIAPESEAELRTILAPLSRTFTADDIKSILSAVIKYKKREVE